MIRKLDWANDQLIKATGRGQMARGGQTPTDENLGLEDQPDWYDPTDPFDAAGADARQFENRMREAGYRESTAAARLSRQQRQATEGEFRSGLDQSKRDAGGIAAMGGGSERLRAANVAQVGMEQQGVTDLAALQHMNAQAASARQAQVAANQGQYSLQSLEAGSALYGMAEDQGASDAAYAAATGQASFEEMLLGVGTAAGLVGTGLSSDIRNKRDVSNPAPGAEDALLRELSEAEMASRYASSPEGARGGPPQESRLDALGLSAEGSEYKYKDAEAPGADGGEHYGPMANRLASSELGSEMVSKGKDGKLQVDSGRAALGALSLAARANQRAEAAEGRLAAMQMEPMAVEGRRAQPGTVSLPEQTFVEGDVGMDPMEIRGPREPGARATMKPTGRQFAGRFRPGWERGALPFMGKDF